MRKIFLIITLCSLFLSCKNDDDSTKIQYESTAIIKGQDLTLCACCGGWVIEIDDITPDYRFEMLPENSNIDLQKATFPINVKLNWEVDNTCGGITRIIIEDIIEI
ncbi:hypothetical protein Q4Q39_11560 [Flavivirga amylovorans]|uniref:Copper resistance protein NlpE n=1 Tax=Flavivirga amylovorans TaxID=870486 RepID=A0ABT8X298_9FLAO|nr:hypothetical protein [Flavivirga amylovorans]MDO5988041.1 hypothetical protein [Flavivirga amylovorans]